MLSQINIKVIWKTKNFFVSLRKTIYIMILLLKYLLVGTVSGCLLEAIIRATGENVGNTERASLICLWPVMLVVFIWNFIKGLSQN